MDSLGIYADPCPKRVAKVAASHGFEAAAERWHWVGQRTLINLINEGRVRLGWVTATPGAGVVSRPQLGRRLYTDMDAAVYVESLYHLGNRMAAERAAGLRKRAGASILPMRGIYDEPKTPDAERCRWAITSRVANGGTHSTPRQVAEAKAALEAKAARELAVGRVLRKALALVPMSDQPASGRYVLPAPGPALEEALRDEDLAVVAEIFPGLEVGHEAIGDRERERLVRRLAPSAPSLKSLALRLGIPQREVRRILGTHAPWAQERRAA